MHGGGVGLRQRRLRCHASEAADALDGERHSEGLAPGVRLAVVGRSDRSVTVRASGREWDIDSVSARNVTIRYLPLGEEVEEARRTLKDVPMGEAVLVTGVSSSCRGTQRRRLLDLGVVPGTEIVPELVSAAGDPVAYRIRGALIGLRREQADWILVEDAETAAEVIA